MPAFAKPIYHHASSYKKPCRKQQPSPIIRKILLDTQIRVDNMGVFISIQLTSTISPNEPTVRAKSIQSSH
jgi:hypothetical protein